MPGKQVMGQLLWHHYTSSPKLRQRKFGLCLSSRHTLVASCRYTLHTSILWLDEWIGLCVMAHTIGSYIECIRYCQKNFVWLGHETTYASKKFFVTNVTVRFTKIMSNLLKHIKILISKVIFHFWKLVKSFQKKILSKKNWTRRLIFNNLKILMFNILYFIKICPIFVGSVHSFSSPDGDIIYCKNTYFH